MSETQQRQRHIWGEPVIYPRKTERACTREGCRVIKVTRHEPGHSWREWWKDNERIPGDLTPPCEGVLEVAAI